MSTTATASASGIFKIRGSMSKNRRWALILSYVCLIIFAIFFLFPPYYMLITSFKTNEEISSLASNPWVISQGATL